MMSHRNNFDIEMKNSSPDDIVRQSKIFLDKLLEQARTSITETAFFVNIYKSYSKIIVSHPHPLPFAFSQPILGRFRQQPYRDNQCGQTPKHLQRQPHIPKAF